MLVAWRLGIDEKEGRSSNVKSMTTQARYVSRKSQKVDVDCCRIYGCLELSWMSWSLPFPRRLPLLSRSNDDGYPRFLPIEFATAGNLANNLLIPASIVAFRLLDESGMAISVWPRHTIWRVLESSNLIVRIPNVFISMVRIGGMAELTRTVLKFRSPA